MVNIITLSASRRHSVPQALRLLNSRTLNPQSLCRGLNMPPLRIAYRFITICFIALITSSCEANMFKSLFSSKEDVVLFSKVQGQILFKGIPVKQAKVIRKYTYDTPQPVEDTTITDDQGNFELPAIIKSGEKISGLVQFVVHQELYVNHNSEIIDIWRHGKMDKSENSEYGGEFKSIRCEITDAFQRKKVGVVDYVYTNCTW
jgi:hypothetical protein